MCLLSLLWVFGHGCEFKALADEVSTNVRGDDSCVINDSNVKIRVQLINIKPMDHRVTKYVDYQERPVCKESKGCPEVEKVKDW